MTSIKSVAQAIIADLNAVLQRLETELGMSHPAFNDAGTYVKQAATALASHPDVSAPATATDAPAASPAPANAAPTDSADTAAVDAEKGST